eukprot:Plantae.Rhodophyta-Purpureofilum_apyrenoidigerum.ctg19218.p1 GENE.Plantae.Rhodophyta-Purpureofilum_apyrenoidigerum.ctg19218~~Plantae.Rhodophyta-Purpureofilum_apyrenoidigerum.ctg19218.p1  ORF type:complete len:594 (+),score=114.72 Plantae.Rhodophyta-Purpureofilum_apyrenoidigerum.ctg19218:131-1912(+)
MVAFVLSGLPVQRGQVTRVSRQRLVRTVAKKRDRFLPVRCSVAEPRPSSVSGVDTAVVGETEKMSVLLPEKLSAEGIAILKEQYNVAVNYELDPESLLEEIAKHEALIVRSGTKVTRKVIEAGKKLKVIGRAGVGVDNIDLDAATERGVLVVNAPTGNCVAAAEHAIALLCGISRLLGRADATLKNGGWDRSKFVGVSLVNKTIAVVGLGRIGREVTKRCKGLGMNVIAHDPYTSEEAAQSLGVRLVGLEVAAKEADFMTLHLPLTDGTRNLVDAKLISQMKPSMHIINAARGGVVNEEALLEALDSGKLAGAALDCFVQEPPNKNPESVSYKLATHAKVLATPHLGASTKEAQEDVAIEIATNVRNALNGEMVPTMVNAPSMGKEELVRILPKALLTERLGRLAIGLAGQAAAGEVVVKYHFTEAMDTRLLRAGLIKGIMQPGVDVQISIVNADGLARKQGLKITEIVVDREPGKDNFISVEMKGAPVIEGRVINRQPTVTRIGNFNPDLRLEGYLLLYVHDDKPGQIGKAGTYLGEKDINISFMTIGRGDVAGVRSLVLTGLDKKPEEYVLKELYDLVGHPELPPVLIDFH